MRYNLKISATSGDIVPLSAVAVAMALRDATAGGTPYHAPTFKGRRTVHILALLEEVRSGRLEVCNAFGSPLAVDSSIEATEHFGYAMRYVNEPDWEKLRREIPPVGDGVWNFSHIDFGPREIDTDSPNIAWFAKLKKLNEWAEKRGDSFSVSHEGVGWVDERGYVMPSKDIGAEGETAHRTFAQNNSLKPKQDNQAIADNSVKKDRSVVAPVPDISEILPDRWYTTAAAARLLGVKQKYLQNSLIHELSKKKKIGRRWHIQGQAILAYRDQYDCNS